jgi:spermidine synthase
MKKYSLELIVFLAGAVTMIFELTGARTLGPYFGASIFIWTSLIGIVMGSLSIGYWLGGKLSVRKSNNTLLSIFLLIAGLLILISAISNIYILDRVVKYFHGFRMQTVVSSILLFGPASVFLGAILPYAVKLKTESLQTTGSTVGNLYALSTVGSIVGTFLGGFILVPEFGHSNILFSLALLLGISAFVLFVLIKKIIPGIISVAILILISVIWIKDYTKEKSYIDVDTTYNRVIIYETTDEPTKRPVRMLLVNDERSAAMFLDKDDDLVFEVLKYYRMVEHFNPYLKTSLMIGGSGYAYPKDYLKRYPDAKMDVVEIDPGLTKLAEKYFNLPDDPRLEIYHEDGRTFLNRTDKKYDAIFMDAYKSLITIPFQLTTKEAIQNIYNSLNDEGVVYANIISSMDEETNYFLRNEYATYKSIFPQVYLFAVQYPNPTEEEKSHFQNIMLVGLKSDIVPSFSSPNEELNHYLGNKLETDFLKPPTILTDEYAPVEFFSSKVLSK